MELEICVSWSFRARANKFPRIHLSSSLSCKFVKLINKKLLGLKVTSVWLCFIHLYTIKNRSFCLWNYTLMNYYQEICSLQLLILMNEINIAAFYRIAANSIFIKETFVSVIMGNGVYASHGLLRLLITYCVAYYVFFSEVNYSEIMFFFWIIFALCGNSWGLIRSNQT